MAPPGRPGYRILTGGGSLTSFGPSWHISRSAGRWKNPRLDEWIQTIKSGGMPNFGLNLIY